MTQDQNPPPPFPQQPVSVFADPVPPSAPVAQESAMAAPDFGPKPRDRIVILGRRRSGKTIFLARLYERLWGSTDASLHMRALDGNSHLSLMKIVDSLEKCQWPAATGGNTYSTFEITFKGQSFPLVMLDYPGEVFRKAFIEGIDAPDTADLIEHVDRALGVLCLVDPGNLFDGDVDSLNEDTFGMVQALNRVRRSQDGEEIPIALVLTKCDVHGKRIKRQGGVRKFVEGRLLNLLRVAGSLKFFASAAVRSSKNAGNQDVPDMTRSAHNVLEPLTWCLEKILGNRAQHLVQQQRATDLERKRLAVEFARKQEIDSKRSQKKFWLVFSVFAVLFGVITIGAALWFALSSGEESLDLSPEQAARVQVVRLHSSVALFMIEQHDGTLPEGFSLGMLAMGPKPYVDSVVDLVDPWGNPIHFESDNPTYNVDYDIVCFGADGVAGGEGSNADIVSNQF